MGICGGFDSSQKMAASEAHEAAQAAQMALRDRDLLLAIKQHMVAAEKFAEATTCTHDLIMD